MQNGKMLNNTRDALTRKKQPLPLPPKGLPFKKHDNNSKADETLDDKLDAIGIVDIPLRSQESRASQNFQSEQ